MLVVKNPCRRCERYEFDPWVGMIPQRRAWLFTPVFLPGETHRQRKLAGYSPLVRKESDMTEVLSIHRHTPFKVTKILNHYVGHFETKPTIHTSIF